MTRKTLLIGGAIAALLACATPSLATPDPAKPDRHGRQDAGRVPQATVGAGGPDMSCRVAVPSPRRRPARAAASPPRRTRPCSCSGPIIIHNPKLHAVIALNPHALADAEALDAEREAGQDRGAAARRADPAEGQYRKRRRHGHHRRLPGPEGQRRGPRRPAGQAADRRRHGDPGQDQPVGVGQHPLQSLDQRLERGGRHGAQPLCAGPQRLRLVQRLEAAVAAYLAPAAIGTETDGSITCPAAINGLVGLKPTVGLVSRTHIVPISHSQDTAGPMTRTVTDAALVADRHRRLRPRRSGDQGRRRPQDRLRQGPRRRTR